MSGGWNSAAVISLPDISLRTRKRRQGKFGSATDRRRCKASRGRLTVVLWRRQVRPSPANHLRLSDPVSPPRTAGVKQRWRWTGVRCRQRTVVVGSGQDASVDDIGCRAGRLTLPHLAEPRLPHAVPARWRDGWCRVDQRPSRHLLRSTCATVIAVQDWGVAAGPVTRPAVRRSTRVGGTSTIRCRSGRRWRRRGGTVAVSDRGRVLYSCRDGLVR